LTAITLPTINRQFTTFNAGSCALNLATVNDILAKLNTWFSANTPTSNLTVTLNGGTNSSPTGGTSNTDIVNLQSIFGAAGKTLFIFVN